MAADLISLDERGRALLKHHGGRPGGDYLVETDPDGTIHLHPAVVMPAAQLALWREDPVAARRIADARAGHGSWSEPLSADDL